MNSGYYYLLFVIICAKTILLEEYMCICEGVGAKLHLHYICKPLNINKGRTEYLFNTSEFYADVDFD